MQRSSNNVLQQKRAELVQTPHSGYHLRAYEQTQRFFEGWYTRVTLPGHAQAFALIQSVEDQHNSLSNIRGTGTQIMGPLDSYLCYHTRSTRNFWAAEHELCLGAAYVPQCATRGTVNPDRFAQLMREEEFIGFQQTPTRQQGRIQADERSAGAGPASSCKQCSWDFNIQPVYGWGAPNSTQKATAGWLSSLPVFEPHWQALMAHGRANGWIMLDDDVFTFHNAPAYAEKNWGESFPTRWFWIQCNYFDHVHAPGADADAKTTYLADEVSVTAAGGRRSVPLAGQEDVAMVGVHWNGLFFEFTPWEGTVEWEVQPWGTWVLRGETGTHSVEVIGTCGEHDGVTLRAPNDEEGLSARCKDTFAGNASITLRRKTQKGKQDEILLEATTSGKAALEVGGGPWWAPWKASASMTEPLRSLVALPLDVDAALQSLPLELQPPGL